MTINEGRILFLVYRTRGFCKWVVSICSIRSVWQRKATSLLISLSWSMDQFLAYALFCGFTSNYTGSGRTCKIKPKILH